MEFNFHLNVKRDEHCTRVAVADDIGEIIDVEEFRDRPDGKGSREVRALAWTMGVILAFSNVPVQHRAMSKTNRK